jgi:hypothetical protein
MNNIGLGPVTTIVVTFTLITLYGTGAFASETYELVAEWGSYGSEEGKFIEAQGIAVGPEGNIYVSDTLQNCRIQKFTSEG